MDNHSEDPAFRSCFAAARLLGLVAIAIGALVMIGWYLDLDILKRGRSGFTSMKPNTALGLILAGVALRSLAGGGGRRRIVLGTSVALGIIGGMTLFESASGIDLRIDQVLVAVPPGTGESPQPGRMHPITSLQLIALSASMVLLAVGRGDRTANALVLFAGFLAISVFAGYLYGMREDVGIAWSMRVSLYSTLGILSLSIGTLLARPDRGLMSVVTADTAGGLMVRQLLPVAVLLPFVVNGLIMMVRHSWSWHEEFSTAIRVVVSIWVLFVFIGRSAHLLHRIDLERRIAADGLGAALDELGLRLDNQAAVEAELRGSEHRYRFLADAMPQIVWTARPDGTVDYYNRRWYEYTGTTFEESRGWGWRPVLHPDDLAGSIDMWDRSLRTGLPFEVEHRFRRAADGAYRWHLGRAVPMRDESGEIVQWIGTSTDIDDQKRAEQELRAAHEGLECRVRERTAELASANAGLRRQVGERMKAEAELRRGELRYRSLVEATTAIVWNTPASGEFESEQPGWSAFTGQPFRRLAGWGWLDSVHADDRQHTAHVWSEAVAARSLYQVEHRIRRRDGAYRHMLVRAVPISGEDGSVHEWIGVHTDIDDQVRAKEAMREAKEAAEAATRAKGEFLANMSHEIRTPMNGILGMTELMLETELSPRQGEYLGLIRSSTEALLTIIDDILDFSKIEAGRLDLCPAAFALRDFIDETLRSLALRAQSKGLDLACRVFPGVPECLLGDAVRLRQVLVNLIGNAIKFTERGEIAVSVESIGNPADDEGLTLHFSVRDTGIGIPADKLQAILEPFIQADGSTTRKYGGTGLGLTICCKLASLMGGRLWVESEPGRGSAFHFTAKLTPHADPGPARAASEPPSPRGPLAGRPLRILLAEDNIVNQKVVTSLLERYGHDVKVVGDGRKAVDAVAEETFDLALMDVQMPIMDGFEAVTAIRLGEIASGRYLPIIALTAHAMKGDRERCLAGGFDAYVPKPVRFESFLAAIEELSASPPDGSSPPRPDGLEPPAFDRDEALETFGGDVGLFLEIVGLFLEECPKLVKQIGDAIAADDAQGVQRLAHTLRGTASHFSAAGVTAATKRLEALAGSGTCRGMKAEYEILIAALDRLVEALTREQGGGGSAPTPDTDSVVGIAVS